MCRASVNHNYKRMYQISLTDALKTHSLKKGVFNTPFPHIYEERVCSTHPFWVDRAHGVFFGSIPATWIYWECAIAGLSCGCVCSLLTSLHACHSRFLSLRKYMHSFDHVSNCQANNKTPSSLLCYACEWSNVLNCLSHVDRWPYALVALKAEHIIWHITHQLQMSEVGGDSGREIVSFRSCVRAVWLPGGIRAQILPGAFPFSLLSRRVFPFPLCGRAFSLFPMWNRSEIEGQSKW